MVSIVPPEVHHTYITREKSYATFDREMIVILVMSTSRLLPILHRIIDWE